MPELAEDGDGVMARIAAVKAEFEYKYNFKHVTVKKKLKPHHPKVMESASETYEQRKKSLEAQNAQMLSEIHEFEFIRSRLKKIVQEESALLDEQGCEDDEDEESQTVAEGIEADRDEKHAPEPA